MADSSPSTVVITQRSTRGFDDTLFQLVATIEGAGLRVFDIIDHAAAATDAGLSLRPTKVVVFGSPAAGTPLMVDHPLLALELPLRILVHEDDDHEVWMSHLAPAPLAAQFGVGAEQAGVLAGPARVIAATNLAGASPAAG